MSTAGNTCPSEYSPNTAGTLLPDGTYWGSFDPAGVLFDGDVDSVLASRQVELIASGFRWTEGPTWLQEDAALLFSDVPAARIYRWTARQGVSLWLDVSGGFDGTNVEDYDMLFEPGSNGMALSGDDLYICQHATHSVVKVKVSSVQPGSRFCDNTFEVLAESFEGLRLNSPNDIVVGPDGCSVWFTDPIYGFLRKKAEGAYVPIMPEEPPAPACHNPCDLPYLDACAEAGVGHKGVYRWRDGKLELATARHERPNGLAFTPDGATLWVANSGSDAPSWTAYAVRDELPLEPWQTLGEREFGPMPGPGLSDGFKIDEHGFIWSSMPAGICIIDPSPTEPRLVGRVFFGTNISNIQFGAGGDVWVTGLGHIWRLQRKLSAGSANPASSLP